MSEEPKKIILLPDKYSEWLSKKPESGMGYQKVDVTLNNGITLYFRTVLNCKELQLNHGDPYFEAGDIKRICLVNCSRIEFNG